jgi:hypothetical protein
MNSSFSQEPSRVLKPEIADRFDWKCTIEGFDAEIGEGFNGYHNQLNIIGCFNIDLHY